MTSQPWDVPEKEITPPKKFFTRRRLLAFGIGLGAAAATTRGIWWWYRGGSADSVLASGRVSFPGQEKYYPATLHPEFAQLDRPLTDRIDAARYCNFYEMSNNKAVWRYVDEFQPLPWKLTISGEMDRKKPLVLDVDDLHKRYPLEERRYRHRCVEKWAMAVPWTGFALKHLLKDVGAKSKYVRFVSFHNPEQASGQEDTSMPWPYTEGLTIEEARNDLTFLATGVYGEPLLKQHGAPIRLVVPWKYGYKSAKSIVRIELTNERPATFWNTLRPRAYGFVSNVDPNETYPWSQKTETMLTTEEERPTQLYNGYGKWVASLYQS